MLGRDDKLGEGQVSRGCSGGDTITGVSHSVQYGRQGLKQSTGGKGVGGLG